MNRPAWRGAGLRHDAGDGQGIAEVLEVLEAPDELLVRRHLDDLRVLRAGVAVDDECVAAGQALGHRHPRKLDAWHVDLIERPDFLARRIHLDDAVAVAGANERVAVGETRRAVELGPGVVFPDDPAGGVVLAGTPFGLVGDEVVAVVELANEPRVAVGVGLGDFQFHFAEQLTGAIDFDDPPRAALGDHRHAVG